MPNGCPSAIAPPCTLSLSIGMPRCLADGITCAANASLISTKSIWSMVMPARFSAWRDASIGPRPMISGFSADTPDETIRAIGFSPSFLAFASLITSTAAAPSFSGQALPAVICPSGRKAGFRPESASTVVPGRGPSSLLMTRPSGSVTGVISRSKKPLSTFSHARCCERAANSSIS